MTKLEQAREAFQEQKPIDFSLYAPAAEDYIHELEQALARAAELAGRLAGRLATERDQARDETDAALTRCDLVIQELAHALEKTRAYENYLRRTGRDPVTLLRIEAKPKPPMQEGHTDGYGFCPRCYQAGHPKTARERRFNGDTTCGHCGDKSPSRDWKPTPKTEPFEGTPADVAEER